MVQFWPVAHSPVDDSLCCHHSRQLCHLQARCIGTFITVKMDQRSHERDVLSIQLREKEAAGLEMSVLGELQAHAHEAIFSTFESSFDDKC